MAPNPYNAYATPIPQYNPLPVNQQFYQPPMPQNPLSPYSNNYQRPFLPREAYEKIQELEKLKKAIQERDAAQLLKEKEDEKLAREREKQEFKDTISILQMKMGEMMNIVQDVAMNKPKISSTIGHRMDLIIDQTKEDPDEVVEIIETPRKTKTSATPKRTTRKTKPKKKIVESDDEEEYETPAKPKKIILDSSDESPEPIKKSLKQKKLEESLRIEDKHYRKTESPKKKKKHQGVTEEINALLKSAKYEDEDFMDNFIAFAATHNIEIDPDATLEDATTALNKFAKKYAKTAKRTLA